MYSAYNHEQKFINVQIILREGPCFFNVYVLLYPFPNGQQFCSSNHWVVGEIAPES